MPSRPPYATDQPDSYYDSRQQPARRAPQQRPQQNSRNSAYDVYDNYLNNDSARNSGVGAAFMNGEMDDSDDEDDRSRNYHSRKPMDPHHTPVNIPVPHPASPPSKNAALAASLSVRKGTPTPPPQYGAPPAQPQAAAIAAPRPGYAAPISALNNAANPNTRRGAPQGIDVPAPNDPNYGLASPSPTSPHPLQAPISPIQPAFARPRPPKQDVSFSGTIMRGEKEETMVPKRGERGDDFWRRFSMVVKEESGRGEKTSGWLRKNQNGNRGFATWVWIVGLILIVAAAGGIGIGWYLSHKGPDHYQPTAIGGSANEAGSSVPPSVGKGGATAKSSLHVSPTNTVARRDDEVVHVTPALPEWMQERATPIVARDEAVHITPALADWMHERAPTPVPESDNSAKLARLHARQRRQHQ